MASTHLQAIRQRNGNIGQAVVLICLCILTWAAAGHAETLVVAPAGELTSIGEAIARSSSGDTVMVRSGVYNESGIKIDKSITLLGVGSPVVDGRETDQIITVTADDVTIQGFIIKNVGVSHIEDRAGVKIIESANCLVEGNEFIDNFFAIYVENSEESTIQNNRIQTSSTRETTSGNGIHLWFCRDISIRDNSIQGHRDGIYLEFVEESLVEGNVSENNLRYGLHFMFSNNDAYRNNVFQNNGAGVAVMYSDNVAMTGNRFKDNWGSASYGLLLKDIRDSKVTGNLFSRNTIGIYSEGSMRLDVRENVFRSNGYAIKIMASSSDNVFTNNNFVANSFDVATNSRNNFSTFNQNYWSRYQGYDLDKDGVGDVPYRPVHLFSLLVEREPAGLILLRSFFIDLMDAAERVFPLFTPETLMDDKPFVRPLPLEVSG